MGLFLQAARSALMDIARLVEDALGRVAVKCTPSLEDILEADQAGPVPLYSAIDR